MNTSGQDKYWISFRDKSHVSFDPYSYFDSRVIEQRIQQKISLNDSSDFPVNPGYLSQISEAAEWVSWSSRWLNGVAAFATEEQIKIISNFPFVKDVEQMIIPSTMSSYSGEPFCEINDDSKALLSFQTQRMQGDSFVIHNLDGKGIRIAIFDVGFRVEQLDVGRHAFAFVAHHVG